MELVARTIKRSAQCRLVIIDPISAYLDGTDANSNQQVRNLLWRLSLLARATNCAVLLVSHLRKDAVGKAVHRTFGSLAFTAAARAVWTLTADPHEPDRRLLLPVKLNLVARPTGLAFRIVDGRVQWADAALPLDADELMHHGTGETDDADRKGEALRFLRDSLTPGPQPSLWIKHRAREQGIGKDALWDAKRGLGITAFRGTGDEHDRWFWRLP